MWIAGEGVDLVGMLIDVVSVHTRVLGRGTEWSS